MTLLWLLFTAVTYAALFEYNMKFLCDKSVSIWEYACVANDHYLICISITSFNSVCHYIINPTFHIDFGNLQFLVHNETKKAVSNFFIHTRL